MSGTSMELAKTQIEECPTVRVPLTGVVVDLTEPHEVARALEDIRGLKVELENVRRLFEGALILESQHQGTKTLHLGGLDAVISGGQVSQFDAELLQEGLRAAGLPEDRLTEAVEQIVTYKVKQLIVKRIAGANPGYAAAVEAARTVVEVPWRVSVKPNTQGER